MSGRTGRVARYTLRLGLLLGGLAVAWGTQGITSGPDALAADRQPSGPLTATAGALPHTPEAMTGPADRVGPADPAGPVASPAPAPARAGDTPPAAYSLTAASTRWVGPARSRAPAAHATTGPAVPPHERVTHSGGAVHSEVADADANRWRLPTLTHRYAPTAAEPLPPSRTSRPDTRPA
ncbi:hypothetical protein ABZU22_18980 [Micromonospora sp. NPDC005222]|uniref:hypothetical protein n=1 Tax=unclassified Micromonospora TaxID=2617518 RepID=UPI00339EAE85